MTLIVLDPDTKEPIEPQREPVEGDLVTNGKAVFEYNPPPVVTPITEYNISSLVVTVNATPATTTYTGDYNAAAGDTIQITGVLENGASIDYGDAKLKLPVVRYAGKQETNDEIYFNATLDKGVLTATGSFPRSGKWRFDTDRINESIDSAGNGWLLSHDDVDFLV